MALKRLTISVDEDVANEIRDLARRDGKSVSQWIREVVERELRNQRLDRFVGEYEAEFGRITEQELRDVDLVWPPRR